jgi:glycosyltransferase involved in cell wall biosynthesis
MDEFDIIHFHGEYFHFPFTRSISTPSISTLHGRLDLPEYKDFFAEFEELPLVSISMNQRRPLPFQNWIGTVYHGINAEQLKFNANGGDYLAFLGRISPEKGVERAVEIACRVGIPLKIAAKIDKADKEYYQSIRHFIDQPGIEFIGEIGDAEKSDFIGNAKALLFPINWPEPFGLVMIEALACGTPVIAFRNGSVPEVIRHGVTGFIVAGTDEACKRLLEIDSIDRQVCRRDFEDRFSVGRMVRDYVKIYEQVIDRFNCSNRPEPYAFARANDLNRADDVLQLRP